MNVKTSLTTVSVNNKSFDKSGLAVRVFTEIASTVIIAGAAMAAMLVCPVLFLRRTTTAKTLVPMGALNEWQKALLAASGYHVVSDASPRTNAVAADITSVVLLPALPQNESGFARFGAL